MVRTLTEVKLMDSIEDFEADWNLKLRSSVVKEEKLPHCAQNFVGCLFYMRGKRGEETTLLLGI